MKPQLYDKHPIRSRYVSDIDDENEQVLLSVDGIHCAGCVWSIENQLKKLPQITDAQVIFSSKIAKITWKKDAINLSEILTEINKSGYQATPYEPRKRLLDLQRERKELLKRLGVAAVLGMQVMIISVALYFGDFYNMEQTWRVFFQKIGMLFTLPILLYSAQTFFISSVKQISRLQPAMDVPVSLGLLFAFFASVWTTLSGFGEVYYDSIAMFVFLLLLTRFYMHSTQLNAYQSIEKLAINEPLQALKLDQKKLNSNVENIPASQLNSGDWIQVLEGHTIPADGIILDGDSSINQAVITGESKAVHVKKNDHVIAGSINNENPLIIEITAAGNNTVLSAIEILAEKSFTDKIALRPFIDTIARWFVSGVIVLASLTALFWWAMSSANWLIITVSVLIISCPCALSLATPTAYAIINNKLIEKGLLIADNAIIEKITKIDQVVFDKTGTLTDESLKLETLNSYSNFENDKLLQIAATLESNTDHPIAKALINANERPFFEMQNWKNHPGFGVNAVIDSRQYFLGSAQFIDKMTSKTIKNDHPNIKIYLADEEKILGEFIFSDQLRTGTKQLINYFNALDIPVMMLTGDSKTSAMQFNKQLDIQTIHAEFKPQDKLDLVQKLEQEKGKKVLMIGDGINDSPVLSAAYASIAVSNATPLAIKGADLVMVNPSLASIIDLHRFANKTQSVIAQNIIWAMSYNLLAIPAAITGFVQPLAAAIGMSVSSIIVVFNSLRLKRIR